MYQHPNDPNAYGIYLNDNSFPSVLSVANVILSENLKTLGVDLKEIVPDDKVDAVADATLSFVALFSAYARPMTVPIQLPFFYDDEEYRVLFASSEKSQGKTEIKRALTIEGKNGMVLYYRKLDESPTARMIELISSNIRPGQPGVWPHYQQYPVGVSDVQMRTGARRTPVQFPMGGTVPPWQEPKMGNETARYREEPTPTKRGVHKVVSTRDHEWGDDRIDYRPCVFIQEDPNREEPYKNPILVFLSSELFEFVDELDLSDMTMDDFLNELRNASVYWKPVSDLHGTVIHKLTLLIGNSMGLDSSSIIFSEIAVADLG